MRYSDFSRSEASPNASVAAATASAKSSGNGGTSAQRMVALTRIPRPTTDGTSGRERAVRNPALDMSPERLASSSVDKLDGLIAELQQIREVLRSEGERVQREVGNYAQLAQAALAATRTISESVALGRSPNVAGQAQTSATRPLSGGREKLRRWPA